MRAQPPPINMEEFARRAAQGASAQRLAARYNRAIRTILAIAKRNGVAVKGLKRAKAEAKQILSSESIAYEEPR